MPQNQFFFSCSKTQFRFFNGNYKSLLIDSSNTQFHFNTLQLTSQKSTKNKPATHHNLEFGKAFIRSYREKAFLKLMATLQFQFPSSFLVWRPLSLDWFWCSHMQKKAATGSEGNTRDRTANLLPSTRIIERKIGHHHPPALAEPSANK